MKLDHLPTQTNPIDHIAERVMWVGVALAFVLVLLC
jgi:hypothetical protein